MTSVLSLFRIVGYGLLVLTLFDVVSALIPPQFGEPGWLFQTSGGFVERSAVPLIGFILAFYGNQEARDRKELLLLKALSWISLLAGIFYLILLVIFFVTLPGLNERGEAQLKAQFDPRINQAQQIQTQLAKADNAQIDALIKSNKSTITDPQKFKDTVIQQAAAAEKSLQAQASMTRGSQKMALIKSAVKWGLGALVSAILFIQIWAGTAWSRQ